jgi:glycosyltransferase involved in cell wall biosynthesis
VNWMDPDHPAAGGAERHLAEIFGRLVAAGHDVTVVASGFRGGASRATVGGLDVVRVGRRMTFALLAPSMVRRLLRSERFDVLIEDLNKLPLRLGGRVPKVVLAHHLWGAIAFLAAPAPLAAITWLAESRLAALNRGARFVAVSESTRWDLVRAGVAPERIRVIANAADPPGPAMTPADKSLTPLFVSIGRLVRYKRVHLILEAAATLAGEGRSVRFAIAGDGPDAGRLRRLAARLGVTGTVLFLGRIDEAAKGRLLRRAWANLLMSRKEGWGLTVLEAGREGTCSVVAAAPGLVEAVKHLEDGLWVPHHYLPTLADGLRYLIDNPRQTLALGQAARDRTARRTWDDAATEMDAALREAVADWPGREGWGGVAAETCSERWS